MREDMIYMSQRELIRLHIVRQVLDKQFKQIEAAEKLNLSSRQLRRIIKRVRLEGDGGIAHRLRGKPSHHRIPTEIRVKVLDIYRKQYGDFGPTFASEKLLEIHKVRISDETLRLWLLAEGLWQKRRKDRKHRQWRERKHRFGEMVQMDGSHHAWFEDRGPECVLMGYIDDATGTKYGQFYEYEGTIPALDSLKHYIDRYGVPYSIYLDRHTTYKSTSKRSIEEQLNNEESLSQFERACRELGIKLIHANSPQAKGRVERSFKTDQDRLVKELRLAGISTIPEANKFLKLYWFKHNKRFSVPAIQSENMHRPPDVRRDPKEIFCIKTVRALRNDFTVTCHGRWYQVLDHIAAKRVTIEEHLDRKIRLVDGKQKLNFKVIDKRPPRQIKIRPVIRLKRDRIIPPKSHPWRRLFKGMKQVA
jgi:hypothetical protein